MRKLYIYGDSFSEYYMENLVEKFWFEILAEQFDLELIHRATSGHGWQRIRHKMFQDSTNWTEDDIIFVCPSYFSRVDIVEFSVEAPPETLDIPWIMYLDSHDNRESYIMEDWYNTVHFLKKVGYQIFTWALDKVKPEYLNICIQPPKEYKSWYDWILSNKDYWVVPYPHYGGDGGSLIEKDTHLSTVASRELAEYFKTYLVNEKVQNSNLL